MVIRAKHCERLSKSSVVGFLGELLVKKTLHDEGMGKENIVHRGNQSGIDLECKFSGNGPSIGIDVKTSTQKHEFLKTDGNFRNWGWALMTKTKKENKLLTHFVCVGLDDGLDAKTIYVVPSSALEDFKIENGISQFRNVTHGLLLPYNEQFNARPNEALQGPAAHMKKCMNSLGRGVKRVPQDGRLTDLLKSY